MPLPSLLLPGCEKAPLKPDLKYVPPGGVLYTTKPGDDWWKLADRPEIKALKPSVSAFGLCTFNFQTSSAPEINWYLRNKAGCTQTTPDKKNYKFSGQEKIHLPSAPPLPTDLMPAPLTRATIQACVGAVKADGEARRRIQSMLGFLQGGISGGVRNGLLVLCDSFSFGRIKACDPSEPNSFANLMVCTGIADAASAAIERNRKQIPHLVKVDTQSRDVPFAHTAVLITVEAEGYAPASYVLDWWRSLNVDHPWVSSVAEFDRGLNGYRF